MLRTLEPKNRAKNKNAEAHFKNLCSYKMKSVYWKVAVSCWIFLESSKSNDKKSTRPLHTFIPTDTPSYWVPFLTIKNDILVTSEISTSILLTFLSKSGVVKTCFFSKFNYVKKSMDVFKIMEEDKWQSQPKNGRFAYD